MGRGRGKGKKQTLIASLENNGHDEEENFPTYKIRGKSIKPMKDEIGEEELEKIEEHIDNGIDSISGKDVQTVESAGNGRKRKMSDHAKENTISMKEEDRNGTRLTTDGAMKMVGFRQNGNRRKNKPRRAAEVLQLFANLFPRKIFLKVKQATRESILQNFLSFQPKRGKWS